MGKNGSGKSSLVALEYRILNNLSCRIKTFLLGINQEHKLLWAYGFNAELYYEMNDEVYCVRIIENELYNPDKAFFDPYKEEGDNFKNIDNKVKLYRLFSLSEGVKGNIISDKDNDEPSFKEIFSKCNAEEDKKKLKELSNSIFYTIVSNYSLYSNIVVSDSFRDKSEHWMGSIYHKNDSYFTPITLLPYIGYYDKLDIKKELELARERVSTLSVLTYLEKNNSFIDGFIPKKIKYDIIDKKTYSDKIKGKLIKYYYGEEKVKDLRESVKGLKDYIKELWRKKLGDKNKNKFSCIDNLKNEDLKERIKENTLEYLAYKTIKMCNNYEKYNKDINTKDHDLSSWYESNEEKCKEHLEKIVEDIINNNDKTDFMNLKIKQCLEFLKEGNIDFYIQKSNPSTEGDVKYEIDFGDKDENKQSKYELFKKQLCRNNLTYDNVFLNLLPDYFYKEFYYISDKDNKGKDDKDDDNKLRPLSSFSSGECQLIFSLSYIIYHIKNISNTSANDEIFERIKYKNINIVLDEAELYYHPEYQRRFIFDLLGLIKRSNFEKVDSINITIITHSPYILSDIPKSNITCLENGKVRNEGMGDTLGANIYDLLKNQFFLDSTIGENLKRKIEYFIQKYNDWENADESNKKEKSEDIKKFYGDIVNKKEGLISYLGEQYLQETLMNMLGKMQRTNSIERLKSEYQDNN